MVNALACQAREDGSIPFIRSRKKKNTLFWKNNFITQKHCAPRIVTLQRETKKQYAFEAQQVERRTVNPRGAGSNPVWGATNS